MNTAFISPNIWISNEMVLLLVYFPAAQRTQVQLHARSQHIGNKYQNKGKITAAKLSVFQCICALRPSDIF